VANKYRKSVESDPSSTLKLRLAAKESEKAYCAEFALQWANVKMVLDASAEMSARTREQLASIEALIKVNRP
jgi:hypothetical protein